MPTTGIATGIADVSSAHLKKHSTVVLRTLLLLIVFTFTQVSSGFAQVVVTSLTNGDILTMVKAKLPAPLIIEKINISACAFDTFPSVLAELKYKGVPDEVLMAMVKAPHGAPRTDGADRTGAQSVPGAVVATGPNVASTRSVSRPVGVATGPDSATRVTNIGGMILHDRSESPYNARFFVAAMDEGFDGMISALMIEKKLPVRVVADESLADFIVVGNTNKGVHKWYDTVFGSGHERDRNQGSIRVIRVKDRVIIWGAQKGDRSFWWGALKKGGKRKVAERLVNKMKGDLFKND